MLIAIFVLSTAIVSPANAEESVCGMDGNTYVSAEAAEAAGVDVSYEFACTNPTSETSLYEAKSDIKFVGMLVEIGSTDVPTTIIVRPNEGGLDRTVEVTANTLLGRKNDGYTKLENWIPGDQITVVGKNNENTDVVEAAILVNHSIKFEKNRGINGWITVIDKDTKTIKYQWANKEYSFKYDDNTRFVAAGKNPASVDDLVINDRIRGRLERTRAGSDSSSDLAKIVLVLRRGEDLFMKIRTFRPIVTLVRLDSTIIPTTIQVKMEATPGIRANDVNNLIGAEGTLITVNIDENTKLTRKYFGETTLSEFSVGDKLQLVGRVNDDGTVDAKLIKNNSIWKTTTQGHAGVVTEVNSAGSYLMVNWMPYKHITRKQLREKLEDLDNTVTAQTVSDDTSATGTKMTLRERLRNQLTAAKEKIGKFTREVKRKIVEIARIKHQGLKLKDLVQRLPVKKIKVLVTADTEIIIGTNANAVITDIKNGDKVRMRGVWSVNDKEFTAETIVVVNSLPEVEEDLNTPLDEVNEVADEIVTDDTDNAIVDDTTSDTEEEVLACKAEGESIPVIANPPVCCTGLTLIPVMTEGLLGSSGICTALCGNGTCDTATETHYNCPADCAE